MVTPRFVPGIPREYLTAPVKDTAKNTVIEPVNPFTDHPRSPFGLVAFGHKLSINVTTGNLSVSVTDIAIPYHSLMLGVDRTYDAQEQYAQIHYIHGHPNTDPKIHLFGGWSFQQEIDIDDAWRGTFGEYILSGSVNSTTYYSDNISFRVHINAPNEALQCLQSHGISLQMLDNLGWQFSALDALLNTKHREYSLLSGFIESHTLIDEANIRLWQFFPKRSVGQMLSSEYHYHDYFDTDTLREVNPSLFITAISDGLGHVISFKPLNPNPPYRSYCLRDGAGRRLELELGSFFSYLDGNSPGGRVKTYLVTEIVDHTTPTNLITRYNYTNDKLIGVENPSSSDKQQTIIKYEYNSMGLLYAIVDPYGNRFTIEYLEDLQDVNEKLLPRIKVSRLIDPEGNIVCYHYDNSKKIVKVRFERNGSVISEVEYEYIQDNDTGQRFLTQEKILVTKGYSGVQATHKSLFYTSDDHFNLEKIEDGLGHGVSYQYDEYNQIIKITDAMGHSKMYFYDTQGKPNSLTPNRYDLIRSETENIDSNGNSLVAITEYTYKRYDEKTSSHVEDLTQSTHRIESFTDPQNNIWKYGYDDTSNYNSLKETSFQNPVLYASRTRVKNTYNKYGYRSTTTDPYGSITKYEYDSHGILARISDPNSYDKYWHYDLGAGWLEYTTDARGTRSGDPQHTTRYKYDRNRLLLFETYPSGSKRCYKYYSNGWLKAVTLFDTLGSHKTSFGYDAVGNLVELRDAKANCTYYEYDEANRLVQIRRGRTGSPSIRYVYDIAGRLIRMVNYDGQNTVFTYDILNRIIEIHEPCWPSANPRNSGKHITFSYDYVGNRLLMLDDQLGTKPLRYRYDKSGNLIEKYDYDDHMFSYKYNPNNLLIHMTDSSGNLDQQFEYDLLDRVVRVKDSNFLDPALDFLYEYTDRHNVNNLYHLNCHAIGLSIEAKYNENNAITTLQNKLHNPRYDMKTRAPLIMLSEFHYTYNNDNLIDRSVGYHSGRYRYDQIRRIKYEGDVGKYQGYDATGNILWRGDSSDPPPTGKWNQHDDDNRLIAETMSGATYTYDSNGNILSRKRRNRLEIQCTFDGGNRLMEVIKGRQKVQYIYNGDGLLVQRKYTKRQTAIIQKFRYFGDYMIMETNNKSDLKALYTRDTSGRILRKQTSKVVHRPGKYKHSMFFIRDPHQNIIQIIGERGNILAHFKYNAWGYRLLNSNPIDDAFGYGELFTDSLTNLLYIRSRWYDPNMQRWISKDHFAGYMEDPMSLNPYLYVGNDPINYTDRKGFDRVSHSGEPQAEQKQESQKMNPTITDVALWMLKSPYGPGIAKIGFVSFANVFAQTGALVAEVSIAPARMAGANLGELQGWGSTFVKVQQGFNQVYRHMLHIPPKASIEQSQPSTDSKQK